MNRQHIDLTTELRPVKSSAEGHNVKKGDAFRCICTDVPVNSLLDQSKTDSVLLDDYES